MKRQILIIGGGEIFKKYEDYLDYLQRYKIKRLKDLKYRDWKSNLEIDLGGGFEVIYPKMPCKKNAKYLEWKIWLRKFFPFLRDGLILIGHSLGGGFLLKYLSENKFPVKISQFHLVAVPVSEGRESLGDFKLPKDFSDIENLVEEIYVYQSEDDPIVPFSDSQKILSILSKARFIRFRNRGHFRNGHFLELAGRISLLRRKAREAGDSKNIQFKSKFEPKPGQIDYSKARWAPVVNCILKYKEKILLLQRSEDLNFYPGFWNGVSGFLDDRKTLRQKAEEEIKEELGIKKGDIKNIRFGRIFEQEDPKYKKMWIVHPALVESKTDKIKLDWEAGNFMWTNFKEAKKMKLLPGFKKALEETSLLLNKN